MKNNDKIHVSGYQNQWKYFRNSFLEWNPGKHVLRIHTLLEKYEKAEYQREIPFTRSIFDG